jgi:serine/threonine-protein kinase
MATPSPDQFWTLLTESKLAEAASLDKLRREFEGLPFPPGASATSATELVARWLVKRNVISEWQAKRLLRGEKGPFFLGDYRLLDRFDTGRGGTVFRARHEPSGRLVGISALNNKYCQQPEVWSDILKRTKAVTEAKDPTLTKTWALEKAGAQRFVLADDVVGVPLADELSKRGAIPVAEAGAIALTVARAVAELHRLGVVHGAISLDTVRRATPDTGSKETEGPIRLLQFPLVADPHVVPARLEIDTPEGVARLGTRAAFLAPELLKSGRISTTSADVYAIGCLFHALLSGGPPGWQGDPQKTLSQVAAGQGPQALPTTKVPVEVATLVSYLTASNPADRYPTAAEAADAIATCLGQPPVSGTLPEQREMITPGSGPADAVPATDAPAMIAVVDTASRATRAKPKPPRPRWLLPALGGLGFLAASIFGAVVILRPAAKKAPPSAPTSEDAAPKPSTAEGEATDGAGATPVNGESTVAPPSDAADAGASAPSPRPKAETITTLVDSGATEIPYESPLPPGPPPRLQYLPPGSQLILLARPAEALATTEGARFVRSLGPRAAAALESLSRLAGCPPESITDIQAAWQAGGPDEVVGGVTLRGSDPLPVAIDGDARRKAWGATTPEEIEGETLHRGGSVSFWLPSDADGHVLVLGPEELVRQTMQAHRQVAAGDTTGAGGDGIEASLPRDLEELVGMLDASRHLTLFGSPDYLLHDGRPVLAGPLAKLVEPLAWFFGDSIRAAALSLHFGPNSYLELDAVPPAGTSPRQLAQRLSGNVATMAERTEEYCNALDPHPYGRKLVMRLPRMLGVVADHVHAGADGRGVIVNAWLPEHAPHNLALAAELALEQTPRVGGAPAVAAAGSPQASTPAGALAALAKPMSLVFVKDTLEKSMQMIADEIGVELEILGSDLQLEGITKNQSFGLDEKQKPAAEILRAILAKANPDGKLVYVIRKTDAGERIEITTRAAVEKRGDTLAPGQDAPTTEKDNEPR